MVKCGHLQNKDVKVMNMFLLASVVGDALSGDAPLLVQTHFSII